MSWYEIIYHLKKAIHEQTLIDFTTKLTIQERNGRNGWIFKAKIYVDDASNDSESGWGSFGNSRRSENVLYIETWIMCY